MREIYKTMFRLHGTLPDEVSRQCPSDLFMLLDMLNEDSEPMSVSEVPDRFKFLYGI